MNENVNEVGNKSGLSIACFVLSIIGFLTGIIGIGLFLDIIAVILGVIAVNGKQGKKKLANAGIIISIVGFILVLLFIDFIDDTSEKNKDVETQTTAQEEVFETEEMEEVKEPEEVVEVIAEVEETITYDNEFVYEELSRDPDAYTGLGYELKGEVIQVSSTWGGKDTYRIALDGDNSKIIYAFETDDSVIDSILEEDFVVLHGVSDGLESYLSIVGKEITIPKIIIADMKVAENEMLIPEFPTENIEFTYDYFSDVITYKLEKIEVLSVDSSFTDELALELQLTGMVSGNDFFNIDCKCYDADGYLIDTTSLSFTASDGEPFKVKESLYIPFETVKIEFAKE